MVNTQEIRKIVHLILPGIIRPSYYKQFNLRSISEQFYFQGVFKPGLLSFFFPSIAR